VIEIKCHGCGVTIRVSDDKGGSQGKCSKCGTSLAVPPSRSMIKSAVGGGPPTRMSLQRALEILELPSKTTLGEARKAYRRLAKQHHPDTGMEKSADRFVKIVTAYEFLKDHVEARKATARMLVVHPVTGHPPVEGPVYELSYGQFVVGLDVALRESISLFHKERDVFDDRLKGLVDAQICSYTSASEFRDRMQRDVDAIIQRELWAFIERIGRKCEVVEQEFRAWVGRMRGSAYEIGLPHGMMEYLSRPGGLVLSVAIFLALTAAAYLAMYMSPLPFFNKGPVPILAGILTAAAAGLISLWSGKAIYTRSARKRGIHERAVFMSQVGFDSFQVGAMPVSQSLSSGERAGVVGGGMGVLALWIGVEPLTGAVAAGVGALLAWATGKSLRSMQKQAKENLQTALQPRLQDFFDGFVDKFLKFNDLRLQRMRALYLTAFGPDDSPALQRQAVAQHELALAPQNSDGTDALLGEIRGIVGSISGAKIHIAPNIAKDKLGNAMDSYAQGVDQKDVLLLYDDTVLGSAKNGLCLTKSWLFWRNTGEGAQRLELPAVKAVHARKGEGIFGTAHVEVNGNKIRVTEEGETAEVLCRIIRVSRDRRRV